MTSGMFSEKEKDKIFSLFKSGKGHEEIASILERKKKSIQSFMIRNGLYVRSGAAYPILSSKRQKELLGRYFVDRESAQKLAADFGYTESGIRATVHRIIKRKYKSK